jgi:hypothetical protein
MHALHTCWVVATLVLLGGADSTSGRCAGGTARPKLRCVDVSQLLSLLRVWLSY